MKIPSLFVPLLALGATALPEHLLEKRRAASCTSYPAANSKLTVCQTNTAFCTSYLGRGPSTSTVYTTTIRKTATPPVVTVKSTSTTKTVTSTVYTRTSTITAPASTTTTTFTTTASVTQSDTATETATRSETLTVPVTSTTTQTTTTTTTVPDIPCSTVQQKRAEITPAPVPAEIEVRDAQTTAPPSCGVSNLSSSAVSGACSCLIDKTTSGATTTTTTLSRSLTTVIVPTRGTVTVSTVSYTTTTPIVTKSTTVTPYTTIVATTVVSTTTVTPFTTTVATITSTVATTTQGETSTVTETSMQPRCTQDDRNSFDGGSNTFVSYCDTKFEDFVVQTVDASNMYDCMDQCQTYNNYNLPFSCVGISFNQAQCNQNCELKSGIYTTGAPSNPNYQSARLLSPAIGTWGNTCYNGAQFGDVDSPPGGPTYYTLLCGMDLFGNDIADCKRNFPPPEQGGEEACLANCDTYSNCTSMAYLFPPNSDQGYSCCQKYAYSADSYMVQPNDVDAAVRVFR